VSRVVVTRDRHLTRRRQARRHVPAVVALGKHLLVLRLARHHARKGEDTDGDGCKKPDDQAEDVEEVGILFAHDARFRGERGDLAAEYSRATARPLSTPPPPGYPPRGVLSSYRRESAAAKVRDGSG